MPSLKNNIEQYRYYFASGHYDRRYPGPNRTVVRWICTLLPENGRILDYGCGSGRYLAPLRQRTAEYIGFDVCREALALLRQRLDTLDDDSAITLLGPEEEQVGRYCERHRRVDLALCLFGVLSHIETSRKRRRVLNMLRQTLKPGGRLLVSVPNRRRRFHREQRRQRQPEQIRYIRDCEGQQLELGYHLYDVASLRRTLIDAGFVVERIQAESLFPESWIARFTAVAITDRWLCRLLPAGWGYGLLAIARPTTHAEGG